MNERIQELAKQAGFKILTDGRIMPTLDHNGECGRDLQKFAELLIKETTNVIIKGHKGHMNPALATDSVKQHFGV